MRLKELFNSCPQEAHSFCTRLIGMTKVFTVLELNNGELYVETEDLDDEGVTTVEMLHSDDRKSFQLISRSRSGDLYNEMRPYARDTKYPLFSMVDLNA